MCSEYEHGHVRVGHGQAMLNHFVQSFTTGSIEEYKEGCRHWIRDK
jgi:hypothetical protein